MQIKRHIQAICTIASALALLIVPLGAQAKSYNQATYYAESPYYGQGTYYSESYYQSSYQTTFTRNAGASSTFAVAGQNSKAAGSFVIDDPIDPANKLLYHSFVESPDAKNIYDGIATLDSKGESIIVLPRYFEALNKDFRYQLKPIGKPQPDLYIKSEVTNNAFTIGGGVPGARVSWQVTGTRHDAFILANPIIPEVDKGPTALVNKGQYLFPEGYIRTFPFEGILGNFLDIFSGFFPKR